MGHLAVTDVDAGHVPRAFLQQTIGESAGADAHVDDASSFRVDAEVLQRAFELFAATADERFRLAQDAQLGVACHLVTRLVDFVFADENAPGHDQAACVVASGGESSLDQQLVKACLGHVA